MSPKSLLTAQQVPDKRQERWALTDVLQSFNADADVIQSLKHQPAEKYESSQFIKILQHKYRPCLDTSLPDLMYSY